MARKILSNSTSTLDIIYDGWMAILGDVELRVFLTIYRKTIGFGKETDMISLTQFEKATGNTSPAILTAIATLQEKELIVKSEPKNKRNQSEFSINITRINDVNWLTHLSGKARCPVKSVKSTTKASLPETTKATLDTRNNRRNTLQETFGDGINPAPQNGKSNEAGLASIDTPPAANGRDAVAAYQERYIARHGHRCEILPQHAKDLNTLQKNLKEKKYLQALDALFNCDHAYVKGRMHAIGLLKGEINIWLADDPVAAVQKRWPPKSYGAGNNGDGHQAADSVTTRPYQYKNRQPK